MTMHQRIRACTFQLSHAPLRWPVVSPGARAPCSASSAIKDAASNRTRSSLTRTRLARAIAVGLRQGVAHAHYVESQVRRRLGRDLTKICDQSVAASSWCGVTPVRFVCRCWYFRRRASLWRTLRTRKVCRWSTWRQMRRPPLWSTDGDRFHLCTNGIGHLVQRKDATDYHCAVCRCPRLNLNRDGVVIVFMFSVTIDYWQIE